jgi:uncharacterized membrane protein
MHVLVARPKIALVIFIALRVLRVRQANRFSAEQLLKQQLLRVPFHAKMVSALIVLSERNVMGTLHAQAQILFSVD